MTSDGQLLALAIRVGERLAASRQRAATAESCTGGWIAKALTDIPGSSAWFEGGFVTYSNEAKVRDLGVRVATLEAHGAVSEAVVREMARGALRVTGVDKALSVSGIAGPGGGSAGKPVGTVWFGLAGAAPGYRDLAERRHFDGDREAVRRQAVAFALEWLRDA